MEKRRNILKSLLGIAGFGAVANAAVPENAAAPQARFNGGLQLFFAFRDTVINFNPSTGIGDHIGTVEGVITGTSMTNFQFVPTSQTTIKYDNRCLISDLEGDQILFQVVGTGSVIVSPPVDATTPLGSLMAFGGPLEATFTVLKATGKYLFLIGRKFPGKMMASNTVSVSPGVIGNVYGEVYSDTVGVIQSAIHGSFR